MKALDIKYPKQQDDIEKLERLNRAYRFQIEKRNEVDNNLIKLGIPEDWADGRPSYRAPLSVQFAQLMNRSWILAQREPRISRAKLAQTAIVVAFLIPTFWQLNDFTNCDQLTDAGKIADCKDENAIEFHSMIGAMYFLCVM
jgi:hypothetical protein